MSSEPKDNLKVTDRRMFTPEGELREEYRFLEERAERAEETAEPETARPDGPRQKSPLDPRAPEPPDASPPGRLGEPFAAGAPGPPPAVGPDAGAPGAGSAPASPPLDLPSSSGAPGSPGFFDLVGMLAEPASIYLGDVPMPDGSTQEDLEMARLHIDLLDVLRQKTAGNLSSRESAVLEDVVYQLKMRYVRKQG